MYFIIIGEDNLLSKPPHFHPGAGFLILFTASGAFFWETSSSFLEGVTTLSASWRVIVRFLSAKK